MLSKIGKKGKCDGGDGNALLLITLTNGYSPSWITFWICNCPDRHRRVQPSHWQGPLRPILRWYTVP
jgi:hypothetical protein